MRKEQTTPIGLEEEKRETLERATVSLLFFTAGISLSCVHPIFIAPTIIYFAEFGRNLKKYDNLVKRTSISEK